jgi:hypothetical protein
LAPSFFMILLFHITKHLSPLFSLAELILTPQKISYRAIWYKKVVKRGAIGLN